MTIENYNFNEALEASKAYFEGDELAASVWLNKYALKDSQGNIYEKTPDDMHRRMAREFARIEAKYENPMGEDEIYGLLKDFRYIIPQGGPMTGIGNDNQVASLSNCFVIGNDRPADSYGGIMMIDQEQVQLMKRRGGVGHDLSHIRPAGTAVLNSALTSTGLVPFMERYSNSTREVAQDGRRGALMMTVSVRHPDAEAFIDAKMEQGKITGANVSVKIDDEFMRAVTEGSDYIQQFPVYGDTPKIRKKIDARKLWRKIIHNAWQSAEPGVLFWDTILRESVADCYTDKGYRTVSTNPCGEIPLCPYDSCRLIAMNLYSYVKNPFRKNASFDFVLFGEHCRKAMRLMDDLIDLEMEKIEMIIAKINSDPEDDEVKRTELNLWKKIRKKSLGGRRTGLGITAEGDMLAALGLRYGSDDATNMAVKVQKTLALEAYSSSVSMARERGAFPMYNIKREEHNPMILRIREADPDLYDMMAITGRRNISMLTIAPTGSASLMTRTTSGIEPLFKPFYTRRRKVNPGDRDVRVDFTDENGDCFEEFNVVHPKFLVWAQTVGVEAEKVKKMNAEQLDELFKRSPYFRSTACDIDWVAKVKMQGRVQKWVDHSISVTVNLPQDVTEDMVDRLYRTAWKSGCKGVTVYREGSRTGVLISKDESKDKTPASSAPRKRPVSLEADIVRFLNGKEKWIAFVGLYDGRPYEIFTGPADEDVRYIPSSIEKGFIVKDKDLSTGKNRYDFHFTDKYGYPGVVGGISHMFDKEYWNYAKLISGVLRNGMPIVDVVNLVKELDLNNESINTWTNGVARALKRYIPDGTKDETGQTCDRCGSGGLVYEEGCLKCYNCGYSKCGN